MANSSTDIGEWAAAPRKGDRYPDISADHAPEWCVVISVAYTWSISQAGHPAAIAECPVCGPVARVPRE